MMKKLLPTLLIALSGFVFAQSPVKTFTPSGSRMLQKINECNTSYHFDAATIENQLTNSSDEVLDYAYQSIAPREIYGELRIEHQVESKIGNHYQIGQYVHGLKVWGYFLKLNVGLNGSVLSYQNHLLNTTGVNYDAQSLPADNSKLVWIYNGTSLLPCNVSMNNYTETYTGLDGSAHFSLSHSFNKMNDDSMVSGKVFMPDPLSTARVVYGYNNTYKHFNDSDYALLNNERKSTSFPVVFSSDTFYAKNKYCNITDIELPANIPTAITTPSFDFLRKSASFKDAMVLSHIYLLQKYLQGLGFNNLVNYSIKVDPAAGFQDNSSFNVGSDTTLKFGVGGVPDAEDADVIIHEYTHAIRYSITPEFPISADRSALEEANPDVMAALYSKPLSDYYWRRTYNWDGWNEFWNGRTTDSQKKYSDKLGDKYYDSEIWSSCLVDIAEAIGKNQLITLMLTSMASYTEMTSMPDAAKLIMQADSIIYGKANSWKIGPIFNQRELGNFASGIAETNDDKHLLLYNSSAFADGIGKLQLHIEHESTLTIYSVDGKSKMKLNVSPGTLELSPNDFAPGLYVLNLQNAKGIYTAKAIRAF